MFKNNTILLVEDNIDMLGYMRLLLESQCKQLFFAKNGEEGIEEYKKNKPDLIITDLNMPVMNGIEMSREIKKDDFLQPIILLTAYGDVEELQEAINIGLNAFLSKPIEEINVLFNTIEKLLKNSYKLGINIDIPSKSDEDLKVDNFVTSLLHDDQEYVDYEMFAQSLQGNS